MDQQTTKLEKAIKDSYSNIAGIVVLKNGKTVYENYFNGCTDASAIHVTSVTKSVTSILFGIAIDKGYLSGVDQKVLEFFPDYTLKRGEKTIKNVTVKHMLTMTAPYKYKSAPYTKYFTSDDWVKVALDLLGGRKGTLGEFRYAPLIGPDILTGILANAAKQSVLDFATENLFGPLGFAAKRKVIFATKEEQFAYLKATDINGWVADPQGINTAGWGLTLTAREMARIGQLYLNGGEWAGKQIVSAAWIDESIKEHSRWAELDLPYGYLWWTEIVNGYAAMGDSGNMIYINPAKKLVVAIASLFKPTAKDRRELIKEYIEKGY